MDSRTPSKEQRKVLQKRVDQQQQQHQHASNVKLHQAASAYYFGELPRTPFNGNKTHAENTPLSNSSDDNNNDPMNLSILSDTTDLTASNFIFTTAARQRWAAFQNGKMASTKTSTTFSTIQKEQTADSLLPYCPTTTNKNNNNNNNNNNTPQPKTPAAAASINHQHQLLPLLVQTMTATPLSSSSPSMRSRIVADIDGLLRLTSSLKKAKQKQTLKQKHRLSSLLPPYNNNNDTNSDFTDTIVDNNNINNFAQPLTNKKKRSHTENTQVITASLCAQRAVATSSSSTTSVKDSPARNTRQQKTRRSSYQIMSTSVNNDFTSSSTTESSLIINEMDDLFDGLLMDITTNSDNVVVTSKDKKETTISADKLTSNLRPVSTTSAATPDSSSFVQGAQTTTASHKDEDMTGDSAVSLSLMNSLFDGLDGRTDDSSTMVAAKSPNTALNTATTTSKKVTTKPNSPSRITRSHLSSMDDDVDSRKKTQQTVSVIASSSPNVVDYSHSLNNVTTQAHNEVTSNLVTSPTNNVNNSPITSSMPSSDIIQSPARITRSLQLSLFASSSKEQSMGSPARSILETSNEEEESMANQEVLTTTATHHYEDMTGDSAVSLSSMNSLFDGLDGRTAGTDDGSMVAAKSPSTALNTATTSKKVTNKPTLDSPARNTRSQFLSQRMDDDVDSIKKNQQPVSVIASSLPNAADSSHSRNNVMTTQQLAHNDITSNLVTSSTNHVTNNAIVTSTPIDVINSPARIIRSRRLSLFASSLKKQKESMDSPSILETSEEEYTAAQEVLTTTATHQDEDMTGDSAVSLSSMNSLFDGLDGRTAGNDESSMVVPAPKSPSTALNSAIIMVTNNNTKVTTKPTLDSPARNTRSHFSSQRMDDDVDSRKKTQHTLSVIALSPNVVDSSYSRNNAMTQKSAHDDITSNLETSPTNNVNNNEIMTSTPIDAINSPARITRSRRLSLFASSSKKQKESMDSPSLLETSNEEDKSTATQQRQLDTSPPSSQVLKPASPGRHRIIDTSCLMVFDSPARSTRSQKKLLSHIMQTLDNSITNSVASSSSSPSYNMNNDSTTAASTNVDTAVVEDTHTSCSAASSSSMVSLFRGLDDNNDNTDEDELQPFNDIRTGTPSTSSPGRKNFMSKSSSPCRTTTNNRDTTISATAHIDSPARNTRAYHKSMTSTSSGNKRATRLTVETNELRSLLGDYTTNDSSPLTNDDDDQQPSTVDFRDYRDLFDMTMSSTDSSWQKDTISSRRSSIQSKKNLVGLATIAEGKIQELSSESDICMATVSSVALNDNNASSRKVSFAVVESSSSISNERSCQVSTPSKENTFFQQEPLHSGIKSILNSGKKLLCSESVPWPRKTVAFGSPEAAEYNVGSPSINMTPIPSEIAKARFSMPGCSPPSDASMSVSTSSSASSHGINYENDNATTLSLVPLEGDINALLLNAQSSDFGATATGANNIRNTMQPLNLHNRSEEQETSGSELSLSSTLPLDCVGEAMDCEEPSFCSNIDVDGTSSLHSKEAELMSNNILEDNTVQLELDVFCLLKAAETKNLEQPEHISLASGDSLSSDTDMDISRDETSFCYPKQISSNELSILSARQDPQVTAEGDDFTIELERNVGSMLASTNFLTSKDASTCTAPTLSTGSIANTTESSIREGCSCMTSAEEISEMHQGVEHTMEIDNHLESVIEAFVDSSPSKCSRQYLTYASPNALSTGSIANTTEFSMREGCSYMTSAEKISERHQGVEHTVEIDNHLESVIEAFVDSSTIKCSRRYPTCASPDALSTGSIANTTESSMLEGCSYMTSAEKMSEWHQGAEHTVEIDNHLESLIEACVNTSTSSKCKRQYRTYASPDTLSTTSIVNTNDSAMRLSLLSRKGSPFSATETSPIHPMNDVVVSTRQSTSKEGLPSPSQIVDMNDDIISTPLQLSPEEGPPLPHQVVDMTTAELMSTIVPLALEVDDFFLDSCRFLSIYMDKEVLHATSSFIFEASTEIEGKLTETSHESQKILSDAIKDRTGLMTDLQYQLRSGSGDEIIKQLNVLAFAVYNQVAGEWSSWETQVTDAFVQTASPNSCGIQEDEELVESLMQLVDNANEAIGILDRKASRKVRRRSLSRWKSKVSSVQDEIKILELQLEELSVQKGSMEQFESGLISLVRLKKSSDFENLVAKERCSAEAAEKRYKTQERLSSWLPISLTGTKLVVKLTGCTKHVCVELTATLPDGAGPVICEAVLPDLDFVQDLQNAHISSGSMLLLKHRLVSLCEEINDVHLPLISDLSCTVQLIEWKIWRLEMTCREISTLQSKFETNLEKHHEDDAFVFTIDFTGKKRSTKLRVFFDLNESYPNAPIDICIQPLIGGNKFDINALSRHLLNNVYPGFGYATRLCDVVKSYLD